MKTENLLSSLPEPEAQRPVEKERIVALGKLVEQKGKELERANRADYLNLTVKGAVGALVGSIAGSVGMAGLLIRRSYQLMRQQSKDAEQIIGTNSREEEKLREIAVQLMERENTLPGFILRNPKQFLLGSVLTGATAGVAVSLSAKRQIRDNIRKDLSSLNDIASNWQERLEAQAPDPDTTIQR